MSVDVGIDVDLLKSEIKKTYASVSEQPGTELIFPTGRAWAEDLDYPAELANVPEAAVASFAGGLATSGGMPRGTFGVIRSRTADAMAVTMVPPVACRREA